MGPRRCLGAVLLCAGCTIIGVVTGLSTPASPVTGTDRLLWATGLNKSYDGSRPQFKDADLVICKGQRIGLIGVNGCGKSTLCKVLAGLEKPDSGSVESPKNVDVVYVPQEPDFPPESTVVDAIYNAKTPLMECVRRFAEVSKEVEAGDSSSRTLARFEAASAAMESSGGWEVTTLCDQIMSRLRISELRYRTVGSLSGGEAKRVSLAAALVQQPDLLILDEPTNHLAVTAIQWLEELLAGVTMVMVTHDRYFLQNTCNEILELDRGKMYRHQGSYSDYLESKAERAALASAQLGSDQNRLRKELAWVRKQPRARQAKSKKREEAFRDLDAKVDEAKQALAGTGGVKLEAASTRLGKTVLSIKRGNLTFDDPVNKRCILKDFSFTFDRMQRIGIVGENGAGKSTFLKVLMQEQALDSGTLTVGDTVRFGYYRQEGMKDLPPDSRVLEHVIEVASGVPDGDKSPTDRARQLLSRFNFPSSRWMDTVSRLSGGEKRRLQLLEVLIQAPNMLILDEPTNDLDVETLNVLEEFLVEDFKGSLVTVSHDRWFQDRCAQSLLVFEGDGRIRQFLGTFSDYLGHLRAATSGGGGGGGGDSVAVAPPVSDVSDAGASTSSTKTTAAAAPPAPPARKKLSYNLSREYDGLEAAIDLLSRKQEELQESLAGAHTSGVDYATQSEWAEQLAEIVNEIDEKTERWMELEEMMESG